MYRKEGADEEWAREYPELAAKEEKKSRTIPLQLTEFAKKLGVTEGPERDRGIEIWQKSGADTGDYVEMDYVYNGENRIKHALMRVCTSGGVVIGLYMGGLLIRFDQIQALEIIQKAGTFYLKDIPEEGKFGYKTWTELNAHRQAKIAQKAGGFGEKV